jgi:hypothetical protein
MEYSSIEEEEEEEGTNKGILLKAVRKLLTR